MSQAATHDFEVFFDGKCPLCRKEIDFLIWMGANSQVRFTDIAADDFSESTSGRSFEQLMAEIHGRKSDGEWLVGVDVFRRLYEAIGWSWIVAPTRWPVLRSICDVGYRWFARNRLRLTGRRTAATSSISDQACTERST